MTKGFCNKSNSQLRTSQLNCILAEGVLTSKFYPWYAVLNQTEMLTTFKSDFWTPIFFFQSTICGLWLMTDIFRVRFSDLKLLFQSTSFAVIEGDNCYTLIIIFTHCQNLIRNFSFYNHVVFEFMPKNYLDCSVEFFFSVNPAVYVWDKLQSLAGGACLVFTWSWKAK